MSFTSKKDILLAKHGTSFENTQDPKKKKKTDDTREVTTLNCGLQAKIET